LSPLPGSHDESTDLLEPMVKKVLNEGVSAKYLLMHSWFSALSFISTLRHVKKELISSAVPMTSKS